MQVQEHQNGGGCYVALRNLKPSSAPLAAEEPLLEPLSLSEPLPTPPTPAPGNSAASVMDQEAEMVFSTHHNDPLTVHEGILLFIVLFSTVTCVHKIRSDPSS